MPASHVRAIRGATTVDSDRAEEIRDATQALLREMCARNAIVPQDVISAIFTVTHDLRSDFPARAEIEHVYLAGARTLRPDLLRD